MKIPAAALVLSALLVPLVPLAAQSAPATEAPRIIQPERVAAAETLRLPARTQPIEEAEIFSRATGIVGERKVDIGDRVKAGEVLAVINAPEIQRRVERAQAAVAQAEARAALARSALVRARSLARDRVVAAETLDEREAAAKTAEADLQAAQAELHGEEEQQNFLTIRAPFDGIVAARRVDRGDHLRGDQSEPGRGLFQLVRLEELRVEVDAPPAAALRLRPGQVARVEFRELPGQSFAARVTRASGVIDRASGTMRFELSLPNVDLAIPAGLTGLATIEIPPAPGLVQVPTNAVFVRDGRSHVAKVQDGHVAFAPVETGRNLGAKIEILSGVSPDDRLILSPNALLQDGQKLPDAAKTGAGS